MQLPRFFQQKVSSWLLVLPGFLLIGLFAVPLRALTVRAINANFFEYALSAQALAALRLSLVTSRPFTASAVVIAQIFVAAPLYVRAARIGFAEIDIQIEEAARVEGANQWQLFCHVMFPPAGHALISGAILAWTRALGKFGATMLFAGNLEGVTQTMPMAMRVFSPWQFPVTPNS